MLLTIADRPEAFIPLAIRVLLRIFKNKIRIFFRIKAQKIEYWAWPKCYWLLQKRCIRLEMHILEGFYFWNASSQDCKCKILINKNIQ